MKKTLHNLGEQIKLFFLAEGFLWKLTWEAGIGAFFLEILLSLFFSLVPLAQSFLWKIVIDRLIEYNLNDLLLYLGLFCLIPFISSLLSSISYAVRQNHNEKIRFRLNQLMSDKLNRLQIGFYDHPGNRDMINKAWQYQVTVQSSTGTGLSIIFSIITLAVSFGLFFPYNPLLCFLYVLTYIPGAIMQYRTNRSVNTYSIDSIPEVRQKEYYKTILTSSEYAKELRLYHLAPYMKEKFSSLWRKIRGERSHIFRVGLHKSFFASLLSVSGLITLIAWSIHAVLHRNISVGVLAMFISLATVIGSRVRVLLTTVSSFMQLTAPRIMEYKRFVEIDAESMSEDSGGDMKVPALPKIEFVNVSFRYPNCENYTLRNLSFTMDHGEKIALVGVNGAGKSTIIKLMLRFYDPCDGQIFINGRDVRDYSLRSLREQFGVYFQDLTQYALSVKENIALSAIEQLEDTEKINYVARCTGADDFYRSLPQSFDTQLLRMFDEHGYEPSGGQWQKIGLARAFFRDASIIILDEPSSALDPEAENFLFCSFKKLLEGKGALIVSHRLSVISLVDKVILLENGSVRETGTHAELMHKNGVYAEMYRLQASKYKNDRGSTV